MSRFYYYYGVIRAIYWSKDAREFSPITISAPMRATLWFCMAGMLYLGLFPDTALNLAEQAVKSLRV